MKRLLLLACASIAIAAPAQKVMLRQVPVDFKAPKAAVSTLDFCYCGSMGYASPVKEAGTEVSGAMYIPASIASKYAGSKVTAIQVFNGYDPATMTNEIPEAEVWVASSLGEQPVTSAIGDLTPDILSYSNISLENPYVIEADKDFYIGFTVTTTAPDQIPIVWDRNIHDNDWGGWSRQGDGNWLNLSSENGFVLIKATFEGEALPQYSVGVYDTLSGGFTYPGGTVEQNIIFINEGAAEVQTLGLEVTVGNQNPINATMNVEGDIAYNDIFRIYVDAEVNETGNNIPVRVRVTEVNGQPNESEDGVSTNYVLCLPKDGGFKRNVVMEQSTSIENEYSPRGIVSNEVIGDLYGTTSGFLPVMVHMYDKLSAQGYDQFFTTGLCTSLPSVIPCRLREYQNSSIELEEFEKLYDKVSEIPAYAKISAEVMPDEEDPTLLTINTFTSFLGDNKGEWRLAYVVRRDNIGPEAQANAFSGGNEGEMGGFENMSNPAKVYLDNVAVLIENYDGVPGTVPSEVKAGEVYEHSFLLHIDESDPACRNTVLVYLINALNGVIENAVAVPQSDFGLSGVTMASEDRGAMVKSIDGGIVVEGNFSRAALYTLSGQIVGEIHSGAAFSLLPGLYIVNVDGKATKVIVK